MITTSMITIQQSLIDLRNHVIEQNDNEGCQSEVINKIQIILENIKNVNVELYQKWTYNTIVKKIEVLKETCHTSFDSKKIVGTTQRINGCIQVHFVDPVFSGVSDLDIACNQHCPILVNMFKYARAKMILGEFGVQAHTMSIEENPALFDCLPRFALLEILSSSKGHSLINEYKKEVVNILNNRINWLNSCTHRDLLASANALTQTITHFSSLCDQFAIQRLEVVWSEITDEVKGVIYKELADEKLDENEIIILKNYENLFKLIRSISQITMNYHREIFCNLTKMSQSCKEQAIQILSQEHGEIEDDEKDISDITIPDFNDENSQILDPRAGLNYSFSRNVSLEFQSLKPFGGNWN